MFVPTRGEVQCETTTRIAPYQPTYVRDAAYSIGSIRNECCARFLETTADVLVMVDDDISPPDGFVEALAGADGFDIVAGAYPVAQHQPFPGRLCVPAYRLDRPLSDPDWSLTPVNASPLKPSETTDTIVEVDAVGAGCLLVHRRVLEDASMAAPFGQATDERGIVSIGEDINFCLRARLAGYRIALHYGVLCDHRVSVWALGLIHDLGIGGQ